MKTIYRMAQANAVFGVAAVRRRVRRDEWRKSVKGVVATRNAPLTRHQKQEVLLCSAPPASALGGMTALERDGFEGFKRADTWIVLAEGARSAPSTLPRRRLGGI